MTDRIFEVEYHPGGAVVLRFKAPKFSLMPKAARGHFRTARKEMLLALRSLLDKAIEQTEEPEKTRAKRKTKIEVQ